MRRKEANIMTSKREVFEYWKNKDILGRKIVGYKNTRDNIVIVKGRTESLGMIIDDGHTHCFCCDKKGIYKENIKYKTSAELWSKVREFNITQMDVLEPLSNSAENKLFLCELCKELIPRKKTRNDLLNWLLARRKLNISLLSGDALKEGNTNTLTSNIDSVIEVFMNLKKEGLEENTAKKKIKLFLTENFDAFLKERIIYKELLTSIKSFDPTDN